MNLNKFYIYNIYILYYFSIKLSEFNTILLILTISFYFLKNKTIYLHLNLFEFN